MSIDCEVDELQGTARCVVDPEHGRRLAFEIVNESTRKRNSDVKIHRDSEQRFIFRLAWSESYYSTHTSFHNAFVTMMRKARAYDQAYSTPRGGQKP